MFRDYDNSPIIEIQKKEGWRFNSIFKEGENWTFKNRIEISKVQKNSVTENGFMFYKDVKYKPLFSKLSFSIQYTFFNTES